MDTVRGGLMAAPRDCRPRAQSAVAGATSAKLIGLLEGSQHVRPSLHRVPTAYYRREVEHRHRKDTFGLLDLLTREREPLGDEGL